MANLVWLSLLVMTVAVASAESQMAHPLMNVNEEPIKQPLNIGRMNEKPNTDLEENLPPIAPIFPSFFQPGNELLSGLGSGSQSDDSNNNNRRRGGILTILVIKSKKPDESSSANLDESSKKIFEENLSKINQFKSQVSESFSKLAGLIQSDLFGQQPEQKKTAVDWRRQRGCGQKACCVQSFVGRP